MKISDAEWEIMKVLWKNPYSNLKEISENLINNKWSYTTIRTLVSRLMEKGAIMADKSSPTNFKYYSALPENEYKESNARNFLAKVFDGSAAMMMAALVQGGSLTEAETKKLKELIAQMEEGEKQ
jgi:BlaI family penicillinase repressor